ncbi:MAG: NAD-dependent epimerase [Methylococcales bacterium]|jgi:UDP-glucuronate 4-epimerase|nr:NAD-dependent epimerase [Methylococcales bacterium]MBT7409700.1 NAD-dependent epimerase [Methylococcales bacterium]
MKILITGAAGFIGSELAIKLLNRNDEVIGIDNHNDYYDPQLKESRLQRHQDNANYHHYRIDLHNDKQVFDVFEKHQPDAVINLAAQAGVRYSLINPKSYIESNLMGFANILEGCRHNKVKHLVFASSSSVYGANTKMPFATHHNVDHPVSLYAATKKSNELMAHSYAHLYDLPVTGLRFFTVYGPWGRPDMAYFSFTQKILAGESIEIFNHGKCLRDFTYIDDIVEGVIRVLDRKAQADPSWSGDSPNPSSSYAPYKIYNIGNNEPIELMYFVELIEKYLGQEAKKIFLPMQPGDVPATYANVDGLIEDVDFKPQTTIEAGLKNFVDWYLNYYK